ncbi:MAG: 4-hydroxy-tetrahydrodipicolinate reductase [Myxococcales bacterium]|nr:4-hydroxy-tetrahydrodipicolinate reductase [Myxococcales bacterium]
MIAVLVTGAGGRMGGHVLRALEGTAGMRTAAALERPGHPDLGHEISPGVKLSAELEPALDSAQVAIDFSVPESTLALVDAAARKSVPLVLATTGFGSEDMRRIQQAARRIPIVMAANFSLGINVLLDLVAEAARRLEGYEIEVLELHHSQKLDAPSGTALALARVAAEARGQDLEQTAVYQRVGRIGERPPEAIGIQSLRAGDSVGEHTVYLAGPGERIELSHRALSRDNFAVGAVRAARWVVGRPPGLYALSDVLS